MSAMISSNCFSGRICLPFVRKSLYVIPKRAPTYSFAILYFCAIGGFFMWSSSVVSVILIFFSLRLRKYSAYVSTSSIARVIVPAIRTAHSSPIQYSLSCISAPDDEFSILQSLEMTIRNLPRSSPAAAMQSVTDSLPGPLPPLFERIPAKRPRLRHHWTPLPYPSSRA